MRFSDSSRLVPDVVVESKAAGFTEIGEAVFSLLADVVTLMRQDRKASSIGALDGDAIRAAFYLRRGTHRDSVYVQGKWCPYAGGVLFLTTAPNWERQVARHGHAVLDGHPVIHVVMRDSADRPRKVWVVDVVMTHLVPRDPTGQPFRVYFGARLAEVLWDNGIASVVIDRSAVAQGAVPVPMQNAVRVPVR